jgi:hypothetical protein
MGMTRKAFLIQLAGGGWALASCGGGGYDPMVPAAAPAPTAAAAGSCTAAIAGNHGHVLTMAPADLDSTVDITYDIHGSADHTHSVTFTAAMLASLKAGNSVTATTSTTLAHNHGISERCV